MKRTLLLAIVVVTGCQSVTDSQTIVYRAVSKERNAEAVVAILKCLPKPDCELLGETLECGPFLWRQLSLPMLTHVTTYTLPENSGDIQWEGRRCENRDQVQALWQAFQQQIPQKSLQTVRSLNKQECRIYEALIHGEIQEPVFILEGGGHKILMQLSNGKLRYIDDLRNVVVRD